VVEEVQRAILSVEFFGLLDTLEYLEKGGRIGRAQAFVGSLLRVKPILGVIDGEAHPVERARTRGKGIDRLCELVQEHMPLEDLAVVHTTTHEEAREFAQRLRPYLPRGEVLISQVGPVVGTYLGPRVLGVALRGRYPSR
jgi:DegV family protein with EDD domain